MRNWCRRGIAFLLVWILSISLFGNIPVYAAPNIQAVLTEGINGGTAYLQREYTENYQYGYEWILYTLLRADRKVSQNQLYAYYESAVKEIKTWSNTQKPTDVARVALALSILGKDITNVEGVNLAALIYNNPKLGNGANELIYALLALDAKQTKIPVTATWSRQQMIDKLLTYQNENGGFGLVDNTNAGADITAMVLQAFAPYQSDAEVSIAINKALEYLKGQQAKDGGFGSAETSAQVLIALSALGIDALNPADGFGDSNHNIIMNLNQYYVKQPSGFVHVIGNTKPNSMATIQVLQAYTAYGQFLNGKGSYWDLTKMKAVDLVKPYVKLNKTTLKIKVKTTSNSLKVKKKLAFDTVKKWKSSNSKVVSVNPKGKLTAKKKGKATITIVMKSGATAKCKVTVN